MKLPRSPVWMLEAAVAAFYAALAPLALATTVPYLAAGCAYLAWMFGRDAARTVREDVAWEAAIAASTAALRHGQTCVACVGGPCPERARLHEASEAAHAAYLEARR